MSLCSLNTPNNFCSSTGTNNNTKLNVLVDKGEQITSPAEDFVSDGYLIFTFNKSKETKVKSATFADVSQSSFYDEDVEYGEEEANDCEGMHVRENGQSQVKKKNLSPFCCSSRLTSIVNSSNSNADLTQIKGSHPPPIINSTPSNHTGDYVRRYSYPNGDTRYDCLSCPLSDMQSKSTRLSRINTTSIFGKLMSNASSRSILVYNNSLSTNSPRTSNNHLVPPLNISLSYSNLSRKMLRCEECGKYYRNEYSLHHHICLKRKDVWKKGDVPSEIIDGQIVYFCPTCRKPFKWLGNLTRHYYVHTGQRFFKCDICYKEFFSAYQVKRHMNSHTGLRFNCEVCSKPFTCMYACAWHSRKHACEFT